MLFILMKTSLAMTVNLTNDCACFVCFLESLLKAALGIVAASFFV